MGVWHKSGHWNMRGSLWGLLRIFPLFLKCSQDSNWSLRFSEVSVYTNSSSHLGAWEQPAYEKKPTLRGGRKKGKRETESSMIPSRCWINPFCPLVVTTVLMQWVFWCYPDSFSRTEAPLSAATSSIPFPEITLLGSCLTPDLPSPSGKPVSSEWFICGYKGLMSLLHWGITLKTIKL